MKEVGLVPASDRVTNDTVIRFGDILNSVFKVHLSQRTINELDYTYERYQEFMNIYEKIENKNMFDEAMCTCESLYLHSMELTIDEEKRNLLKSIENKNIKKSAIKYMCEKQLSHDIKIPNIKRLHTILLEGVALEESKFKSFRKTDVMFVGEFINEHEKYVLYYPPFAKDIQKLMEQILVLLNDPSLNQKEPNVYMQKDDKEFDKKYSLLVQPLMIQALISIVQPFLDGNTRTSRVINYAMMLNRTNLIFGKEYTLPLVYLSKYYYPYHKAYRNEIKDIAINPTDDKFIRGFRTIQEYIDYATDIIMENQLVSKYEK